MFDAMELASNMGRPVLSQNKYGDSDSSSQNDDVRRAAMTTVEGGGDLDC